MSNLAYTLFSGFAAGDHGQSPRVFSGFLRIIDVGGLKALVALLLR
ncbi:hypothetical protein [Microbulbifer variabilis]|nr:hypothetical protein [Microbulbifer variabilis]